MKVILNEMVSSDRRRNVESVVRKYAENAAIEWHSSSSLKVVLAIEAKTMPDESFVGSIFQSPMTGERAVAAVTDFLEERIWISMSASDH